MFFDYFIDSQNVSYFLLKNSLKNDKLSHAYLIDANNNDNAYDFVLAFVKMILCDYHYSNFDKHRCGDCNKCLRVQDGNYSEIRIIESDSNVIKKEQLIELQEDFSKSSIEGKYRIYIIKDCDKMNKHASNSLLKFLEEPVEGIIAILVTNHFSKVLSTVVSRCQVIRLSNVVKLSDSDSFYNFALLCCDNKNDIDEFLVDDKKRKIFDAVYKFILYFEENGLDSLIYLKDMWYNYIQSREDNLLAFKAMIYLYYDVLNYIIGRNELVFVEFIDSIEKIASLNSIESILEKINIVQYGYDMILCNLNVNLLMDDIIIRLGEV